MTGDPEKPPFARFGGWYLALKILVLVAAVLLTLKLTGMF